MGVYERMRRAERDLAANPTDGEAMNRVHHLREHAAIIVNGLVLAERAVSKAADTGSTDGGTNA